MDPFLTTLYSLFFQARSELKDLVKVDVFPSDGSALDVHREKERNATRQLETLENLITEYMATNYLRGRVGKPQ